MASLLTNFLFIFIGANSEPRRNTKSNVTKKHGFNYLIGLEIKMTEMNQTTLLYDIALYKGDLFKSLLNSAPVIVIPVLPQPGSAVLLLLTPSWYLPGFQSAETTEIKREESKCKKQERKGQKTKTKTKTKDLITILEAILSLGNRVRNENLMSSNVRKTAVLKKVGIVN